MPNEAHDPNELKELTIRLPRYLIDLFKQQSELNGRTFNGEMIDVLEKAIFISPETLERIRDTELEKADIAAIKESADEESQRFLKLIQERNKLINDISMLKKE
ncbi:MAG: hypothetical protein LBK83_04870 [Treponema sp.]|jgi:hypothetical protein|nr:hypothetical protein [Treponema sp.]